MSYNFSQKTFRSSRPGSSSSSDDSGHGNPIAFNMAVPKGRVLRKPSKEGQRSSLRRPSTAPSSSTQQSFELQLMPGKSSEDSRNFDRQPQTRAYTGKPSFIWPFRKQRSLDPKTANQLLSKDTSSISLPQEAPTFRMVGRGGSGSRIRQGSSIPTLIEPNVTRPHQPLKYDSSRPIGRGGVGSSSRPLIPSTSILDLLSGNKPSQPRRNERKLHKHPPPSCAQSVSPDLHCFTTSGYSRDHLDDRSIPPSAFTVSSTSGGRGSFISRNSDLDDNSDFNSYVEEGICSIPNEHQRRLNKLARTLGALPPSLMEGHQSGPVSKSPVTFNNSSQTYSETLLTNPDDQFQRSRSSHRNLASSTLTDDVHRFDLADFLSRSQGDLDDRYGSSVESDSRPPSPITFAPPPPTKKKPPQPLPLSDNDSSHQLTGLYSLMEPSLPSPPATRISMSPITRRHFR